MCMFSFIIFWIACGVAVAGGFNAYFRGKFSHIRYCDEEGWFNLCQSIFFGFGGPISLIVVAFSSGFFYYGWNLKWRADSE